MLPLKVELHGQLLSSPPPYSIIYPRFKTLSYKAWPMSKATLWDQAVSLAFLRSSAVYKIQDSVTRGMTDKPDFKSDLLQVLAVSSATHLEQRWPC